VKRGRCASLAQELLAALLIGLDGRRQELEGDGPAQPRVLGAVHLTHAAGAEALADLVL
jgi:hypothetical protein